MATSTNKAKSFFEQRKNAIKTATIVEAAAATATEKQIKTKALPEPQKEENNVISIPITTQEKATGEKISSPAVPIPSDLKNFIEKNNFVNKINVNLPIEIDNKLQIALLQLKAKYALNNRQMNKTVLLSYIVDKMLQEDDFFRGVSPS
jgi:hypothetical protein